MKQDQLRTRKVARRCKSGLKVSLRLEFFCKATHNFCMLKKIIKISVLLFLCSTAEIGLAAVTPLSVGIVPPLQFPPSDFTITGLRASLLWGRHRDMYGLDLGVLGNITDGNFVGLGVSGIFNLTHGSTTAIGAQLAGLTNVNTGKTSVVGVQAALGLNVNTAESTVTGLQLALLSNYSPFTTIYGVQVGIYNTAREVYGLQIGIVNHCTDLHGLQIGLMNFHEKGIIGVSPILNAGF